MEQIVQRAFGTSRMTAIHQLVVGLVVLAALSIPVECDASNGPHSVFLSPSEAGVSREGGMEHQHAAPATSHDHDMNAMEQTDNNSVATDIDSQRGMNGFDVPFTINPPAASAVETASVRSIARLNWHDSLPAPLIVAPEPPPPR